MIFKYSLERELITKVNVGDIIWVDDKRNTSCLGLRPFKVLNKTLYAADCPRFFAECEGTDEKAIYGKFINGKWQIFDSYVR
jgi:hypothetical protein